MGRRQHGSASRQIHRKHHGERAWKKHSTYIRTRIGTNGMMELVIMVIGNEYQGNHSSSSKHQQKGLSIIITTSILSTRKLTTSPCPMHQAHRIKKSQHVRNVGNSPSHFPPCLPDDHRQAQMPDPERPGKGAWREGKQGVGGRRRNLEEIPKSGPL